MNIDSRLFVKIHPFEGPRAPTPHPVRDGGFDVARAYKVLGMYNPSETGEAYLVLANPQGQIWFISNRHLRAIGLSDSGELSVPLDEWAAIGPGSRAAARGARDVSRDASGFAASTRALHRSPR